MSALRHDSLPIILPLRHANAATEVERVCPGTENILACDFYVDGAERGDSEPGGLRLGRILNVDHHAPLVRMHQRVTSTQLAAAHLAAGADRGSASIVVINHTDCDSMLSSAMLLGLLPPEPDLIAASICADHTGEENAVADLLQALDEGRRGRRSIEDYQESLREVERVREGRAPSADARRALDGRQRRRDAARELAPRFETRDALAFAVADHSIDSAFFPALARDAAVVMVACPNVADHTRWTVKLRLGESAPVGLTLQALGIERWDDRYGGRWNAGSNGRGGGTDTSPEVYAERVRAALGEVLRAPPA